jgi:peptidoglycan/xylan/chitin deacetylase (PgdA/CDA1 family)
MYHYIRDLNDPGNYHFKALDIKDFKEQLIVLKEKYSFTTMEAVIDYFNHGTELKDGSILLTFDDGYRDHLENVFPILQELKIQGSFFPLYSAIVEKKLLSVNKIHLLLATHLDPKPLIDFLMQILTERREEYGLESVEAYYTRLAKPFRFDSAELIFFKRLLQKELPSSARIEILDEVFRHFFMECEQEISEKLYMNLDELKVMKEAGMHIGGHGDVHDWLSSLTSDQKKHEIQSSMELLRKVGVESNYWSFCYPYGDYNDEMIRLLDASDFQVAFTTEVEKASLRKDRRYVLPRFDTNNVRKELL